ncbi:MAG: hypothetical protein KC609_01405, partial [Myxococcales bacterium]|nr:hypothetical protein [Myxococcales bacterium]
PASIIAEAEALASAGSRPTTAGRGMPAQPLNTKLPASADGVPTFDPRRGEDVGALDGEARDEARDEEGDAWVNAALADGSGLQHAVDELKRRMIRAALRQHEGNKSRVAEALGVGRRYLYTLMEKLGLDSEEL